MKIFTNKAITEQMKMFKVMFLLKQNQLKKTPKTTIKIPSRPIQEGCQLKLSVERSTTQIYETKRTSRENPPQKKVAK